MKKNNNNNRSAHSLRRVSGHTLCTQPGGATRIETLGNPPFFFFFFFGTEPNFWDCGLHTR